ncbi:hypothetical protein [Halomonas sp. A29]|uniref:hypothetical protein n=1 Tax=Halomonas sp. A29 TaxID=3102786 RepID=UPI00398B7099
MSEVGKNQLGDSGSQLMEMLKKMLVELEERGDIVLCAGTPNESADFLYSELRELMPSAPLTVSELSGLRALTLHAIRDVRFFDWEMPTLTGFNAEEFEKIAEKLPKG